MIRFAIVDSKRTSLETVRAYLPSNYDASQGAHNNVIQGTDDHGWTLDGYVLPRLASGLIAAHEIASVPQPADFCRVCGDTLAAGRCRDCDTDNEEYFEC